MQTDCGSVAKYSIKEASGLTGIAQTTLREWEAFFQLPVRRNYFGHRKYTEESLNIFREIKKYKLEGLRLEEIKPLININSKSYESSTQEIEIIESMPEQTSINEQNYNLLIKPYENRISELKTLNIELMSRVDNIYLENRELVRNNATLTERVTSRDEIIRLKDSQLINKDNQLQDKDSIISEYMLRLQELESRLSRKWWKIWK